MSDLGRDNARKESKRLASGDYIVRFVKGWQSYGAGTRANFDLYSVRWLLKHGFVIAETPLPEEPVKVEAPVAESSVPAEPDLLSAVKKVSPRASKGKRSKTSSK